MRFETVRMWNGFKYPFAMNMDFNGSFFPARSSQIHKYFHIEPSLCGLSKDDALGQCNWNYYSLHLKNIELCALMVWQWTENEN